MIDSILENITFTVFWATAMQLLYLQKEASTKLALVTSNLRGWLQKFIIVNIVTYFMNLWIGPHIDAVVERFFGGI